MAEPPSDVSASELWTLLSARERPYELVDFPQFDPLTGKPLCQVAMWPLTQGEIIIAKAEATKVARAAIKEKFDLTERVEGYVQVFEEACASEIIFRCCRSVKDPINVAAFPSAAAVRFKLTGDEMAVLISSYTLVQRKLGPISDTLSEGEFEAWIERLKVGGNSLPLASFSSALRIDLIMYLVDHYVTLPMDKSSVGSPPEEPTESSLPTESPRTT